MKTKKLKNILIVEDSLLNRKILKKLLSEDYTVYEAENGKKALEALEENKEGFCCIILDLVMPVMDGFEFLTKAKLLKQFNDLPIIVATGQNDNEVEKKALELGAWDFITKPYSGTIIRIRIRNAIMRSQMTAFERLKYLAEYDTLTRIYNKNHYIDKTQEMLSRFPQKEFVLIRFDIDRFQLVNSFFGNIEGDRLLIDIANKIQSFFKDRDDYTCGRIYADIFSVCFAYTSKEKVESDLREFQKDIKKINKSFDIVMTAGIYYITDRSLSVSEMIDNATNAAKPFKGNYITNIGIYSDEIGKQLAHEQKITNEMTAALENNEFVFYLQPKYSLTTNKPCGAEALVRWIRPNKGLVPPGEFIPVFEKNGFVTKIDFFVWEGVCKYFRHELDEGRHPLPVSVNISRVNMYNPNIAKLIKNLVDKYDIPVGLLELEVTESAWMDNPSIMKKIINEFRANGFKILMDDFGNGYSSLSMLKDIPVDILKIDMGFMRGDELDPGRGENIIASIIRMAKWLNIPVVTEGVEKANQVEFLRSVGCEAIQGYFFAKPMPVADYDKLIQNNEKVESDVEVSTIFDAEKLNHIWRSDEETEYYFANSAQPTCIYSYDEKTIEILRANKSYLDFFMHSKSIFIKSPIEDIVDIDRSALIEALNYCVRTGEPSDCEYRVKLPDGQIRTLYQKMQQVNTVGKQHVFYGTLMDISSQKEMEAKVNSLENALKKTEKDVRKMLVVDDSEVSREILNSLFQSQYDVVCFDNGKDGLDYIKNCKDEIAIILLDMVMPTMSGEEFLLQKTKIKGSEDIPVVVISAEDNYATQKNMLKLGVNDYITKPFVNEVVYRRIRNVLEYSSRFRIMAQEYRKLLEKVNSNE